MEQISSHHQLFHICLQFVYNKLTTNHKELQVFLELMDNHCVIYVTDQDIFHDKFIPNFFARQMIFIASVTAYFLPLSPAAPSFTEL